MPENPLATPVQFLKGCGPDRAQLLAKLGLNTVEDVLFYLPRDVLDLTDVRPPSRLEAGVVQTVRGRIADVDAKAISRGRTMQAVLLDCGGEYVRGVWFNQVWVQQTFQGGGVVLFSGKPKRRAGRWEFPHPRVQWLEDEEGESHGGVLPRYGLTEGLRMHEIRRIIRTAVEQYADAVPEHLPEFFRDELKLPHVGTALRSLHQPSDMQQYETARHRLLFDDLLEFQLALAMRRRAWKRRDAAPELPLTPKIDARIRRLFPFAFTPGQNEAVREICDDLASGRAMHRLLQADVGAGKTAVAIYAMLVTITAGRQTVLMAPTEVLAVQHWGVLEDALAHSRVKRQLLTGQLTSAQRRNALAAIRSGEVDLVVGTQAVIQQDVEFERLGLAVIDEQHKFGVAQRARFSTGHGSPHVLVMTATPIPRSLCLTQFGDLDVTVIRDMPPGRQKVVTSRVRGPRTRAKAWDFIRRQLAAGRQAFVVCPRIEGTDAEAETPFVASAEQVYQRLVAEELQGFRVGLAHGQMDAGAKTTAMDAFRHGELDALVATTVVEVGVDVPNATIMAVIEAEHFGLSQLHQLRGRIGRGKFPGYCFLFSETDTPEADRRLQALVDSENGFEIAEVDFQLRGPGDVLGTRQHGEMPLRVANIHRDQQILGEARTAAFALVESGRFDEPECVPLKVRVLDRFAQVMDLPQSG